MQSDQLIVPEIDAQELKNFINELLPQAEVTLTLMNPKYGSWQIEATENDLRFEYFWGPLSGFGFTDINEEPGENDSPFDPYGVNLQSLAEAKQILRRLVEKRN